LAVGVRYVPPHIEHKYINTFLEEEEPEPPSVHCVGLRNVNLHNPLLHEKHADGFSLFDFMPCAAADDNRMCKDPRCQYLAAEGWEFCCGKCEFYFEEYGGNLLRPKKKHCNRCWRVYS